MSDNPLPTRPDERPPEPAGRPVKTFIWLAAILWTGWVCFWLQTARLPDGADNPQLTSRAIHQTVIEARATFLVVVGYVIAKAADRLYRS